MHADFEVHISVPCAKPPQTPKRKRAQKPASGSYEIFEDFRRAHKKRMQMSDQRLAPVLDLLGKLDPACSV